MHCDILNLICSYFPQSTTSSSISLLNLSSGFKKQSSLAASSSISFSCKSSEQNLHILFSPLLYLFSLQCPVINPVSILRLFLFKQLIIICLFMSCMSYNGLFVKKHSNNRLFKRLCAILIIKKKLYILKMYVRVFKFHSIYA